MSTEIAGVLRYSVSCGTHQTSEHHRLSSEALVKLVFSTARNRWRSH